MPFSAVLRVLFLLSVLWETASLAWGLEFPLTLDREIRFTCGELKAISPDETLCVTAAGTAFMVWKSDAMECGTDEPIWEYSGPNPILEAHFSADGSRLLSLLNGEVRLWNAQTGECLQTIVIPKTKYPQISVLSPDASLAAVWAEWAGQNKFWLLDLKTGKRIHELSALPCDLSRFALAFSPDGKRLAACGRGCCQLCVWDVESGERTLALASAEAQGNCLSFSPDGKFLVVGAAFEAPKEVRNRIFLFDSETGERVQTFYGAAGVSSDLKFSPDGKSLAVANSTEVFLWDAASGELLRRFQPELPPAWIRLIAFSPDGSRLMASDRQMLCVWDAADGTCLETRFGLEAEPESVVLSPDGRFLAFCADRLLILLDAQTGKRLKTISCKFGTEIICSHFQSGESQLLVREDSRFRFFSLPDGECVKTIRIEDGDEISWEGFSPDGREAVITHDRFGAAVRDLETGQTTPLKLLKKDELIFAADYSRDGRFLALGSNENRFFIWDRTAGKLQRSFLLSASDWSWWCGCVLSPDGQMLAWSEPDEEKIQIENLADPEKSRTLHAPEGEVFQLDFSPDGKWLVSSGRGPIVRIWDVVSGECLQTIEPMEPIEMRWSSGIVGPTDAHWSSDGSFLWLLENEKFQIWK